MWWLKLPMALKGLRRFGDDEKCSLSNSPSFGYINWLRMEGRGNIAFTNFFPKSCIGETMKKIICICTL
jgi:hypothetical protein